MFHVGITAGLHELAHQLLRNPQLLRSNYCGNPNLCARNTAILF